MFRHRASRRQGSGLGLLLLGGQLMRVGLDHIPPATLATIAINVAVYLKILNPYLHRYLRAPGIKNVCVSAYNVWYQGDWTRLTLAAWFHLDDWHLYYNMSSFLWKGISLERRFGTLYFAYLIVIFSLLTNITMVALNIAIAEVLEDHSYIISCAAGFSGVIFALKVLTTHYSQPGTHYIIGIPVPSRYAYWAELVLIQLIVPRASFTGHLAGILVGLAFIKSPLKSIVDLVPTLLTPGQGTRRPTGSRTYTYTVGRASGTNTDRQTDSRHVNRSVHHPGPPHDGGTVGAGGMSEELQLQEAIQASHQQGQRLEPSSPSLRPYSQRYTDIPRGQHGGSPTAPPLEEEHQSSTIYPDLAGLDREGQGSMINSQLGDSNKQLRQRRLARFDR